MFSLIAAVATDGAIGQDGGLPWGHLPLDMRWFHTITTAACPDVFAATMIAQPEVYLGYGSLKSRPVRNVCLMGRRTYESISSSRTETKLPGRDIVVIGNDGAQTIDEAILIAERMQSHEIFVCGGAQVYAAALKHDALDCLYLTEIDSEYPEADTWFPSTLEYLDWGNGIIYTPYRQGYEYKRWARTHVSPWIESDHGPSLRFGIWKAHKGQ